MRIAVTGKTGQVATALIERGWDMGMEVIPIGRPEFDLTNVPAGIDALAALRPNIIVSAAAYTAVDKAESEQELADALNGAGPLALAQCAAVFGVPIIHLSTDYVFDGRKDAPYVEDDCTNPLGVYGRSKLAGEQGIALGTTNHVILRTAWIYSPFSSNFVKTMLRLAADSSEIRVVDDQIGSPTSAHDIADAVLAIARNLIARPDDARLRGVFHLAGTGHASWAEFASAILAASAALGGASAAVTRIVTAQYPTPAKRPANSRLSSAKLASVHGVTMPEWQSSMSNVVARVVAPSERIF